MNTFLSRCWPACVLGLAVAAGCSQGVKKVTVKGTVSYKGQPVRSGILQFVGADGSYSAAVVQPDGTFLITDVVPGEVRVGVQEAPSGGESSDPRADKGGKTPDVPLPVKYKNPQTSGLSYTITPDTKQLDIHLEP